MNSFAVRLASAAALDEFAADVDADASDAERRMPELQHFAVPAAEIQDMGFAVKGKAQAQADEPVGRYHADQILAFFAVSERICHCYYHSFRAAKASFLRKRESNVSFLAFAPFRF